ncbi:MAG: hypothetical protein ACKOBH_02225, partial [bacterium]
MSKPREVLIYPGSPKTGTTALQAVLRCSVPGLKAAGWNYLRDPQEGEPDALGSGNCMRLFPALAGFCDADPLAEFEALAPAGERPIAGKVKPVHVPGIHQWLEENISEQVERFNADLPPGTDWELKILDRSKYELEDPDPHPERSPEYTDAIYYL